MIIDKRNEKELQGMEETIGMELAERFNDILNKYGVRVDGISVYWHNTSTLGSVDYKVCSMAIDGDVVKEGVLNEDC